MKELKEQLEWLIHRQRILEELVELNCEFQSDFMKGFNKGIEQTLALYVPEIQKIKNLIEGNLIDDLNVEDDEFVGASIDN